MDDPTSGTTAAQVEGQPGTGAPAEQPASQPSVPGAGQPAGTLPEDVHPAVREAREKNRELRSLVEDAYILDDQGRVVGIREEFAQRVAAQYQQPAAPGTDANARLEQVVQKFADQYGMLPEQVRGIISLVDHVAQERAKEYGAPLVESTLDQMKTSMIASGGVPRDATPYINKWFNEARRVNPRAVLTAAGRETVMRQALGDYAWDLLKRRAVAGQPLASPGSPTMLRPTPGGAGVGTPTADEQALRQRLGLPANFTENTPKDV